MSFWSTSSGASRDGGEKMTDLDISLMVKERARRRESRDVTGRMRRLNTDLMQLMKTRQQMAEVVHKQPWSPELKGYEKLLIDEDAWQEYVRRYLFSTPALKLPPASEVDVDTLMKRFMQNEPMRPPPARTCVCGFYPVFDRSKLAGNDARLRCLQQGARIPNTVLIRILWATRTLVDVELYRQEENRRNLRHMEYETIEFSDSEDAEVTVQGLEQTAVRRRTKHKSALPQNKYIADWLGVTEHGNDERDSWDSEDEAIDQERQRDASRRGPLVYEEGYVPPSSGTKPCSELYEDDDPNTELDQTEPVSDDGKEIGSGGVKGVSSRRGKKSSKHSAGRKSGKKRSLRPNSEKGETIHKGSEAKCEDGTTAHEATDHDAVEGIDEVAHVTGEEDRRSSDAAPTSADRRHSSGFGGKSDSAESPGADLNTDSKVSSSPLSSKAGTAGTHRVSISGKSARETSPSDRQPSTSGRYPSEKDHRKSQSGEHGSLLGTDASNASGSTPDHDRRPSMRRGSSQRGAMGKTSENGRRRSSRRGTILPGGKHGRSSVDGSRPSNAAETTDGLHSGAAEHQDTAANTKTEKRSLQMGSVAEVRDMVCESSKKKPMTVYERLVQESNAFRRLSQQAARRKAKQVADFHDGELHIGVHAQDHHHDKGQLAGVFYSDSRDLGVPLDEEPVGSDGTPDDMTEDHLDPEKSQAYFGIGASQTSANSRAKSSDSGLSQLSRDYLIQLLSQSWIYEVIPEATDQLLGPWKIAERLLRRFPHQESELKVLSLNEISKILKKFSHVNMEGILHSLITFLHAETEDMEVFDAILCALESIGEQMDTVVANVLSLVNVASDYFRTSIFNFLVRLGLADPRKAVIKEAVKWGPTPRRKVVSMNLQKTLLRNAFNFVSTWRDLFYSHAKLIAEELNQQKIDAIVRLNILKILHNYNPEAVVETPEGIDVNLKQPSLPELLEDVKVIEALNYFVEMSDDTEPSEQGGVDPLLVTRHADPLEWRRNNVDILVPPCQNRSLLGNLPLLSGVPQPTSLVTHDPQCGGLQPMPWPGVTVGITLRISDKFFRQAPPTAGFT